jgi:hypothetical protein
MTALARANSNCKRQTLPVVRESAPHQQSRSCLTVIKTWSWAPDGFFIPRQTGRLTVGRNIRLRLRRESYLWDRQSHLRSRGPRTRSRHGKELWGFSSDVLTCWRRHFMCYIYSNLESVISICSYDLWVSNKSIHQSKPRLQVTNTRDDINELERTWKEMITT